METISDIKKELSNINNTLNNLDTSIYIRYDPDCIFESKQYCNSDYYMNIKPDEASEYIQKVHQIHDSIRLITNKSGLEYLLSEVILLKNLAIKSDEVYHYPYFFDLYSSAEAIEKTINTLLQEKNCESEATEEKVEELYSTLPDWTKSESGRKLLEQTINKGYIIKDTCKWDCSKRGRKSLLAYFIDKASDYLDIRPENERIPWSVFNFLMNSSNDIDYLKGIVSNYKHPERAKPEPNGFRDIKKLFE